MSEALCEAWRFLSWVAERPHCNKFACVETPSGIAWHGWDRPAMATVFIHGDQSGWVVQRLDNRKIIVGLCKEFWRADMARVYIELVGLENVKWRQQGIISAH